MGFVSGCAARRVELPTGPSSPLPDFAAVHQTITSACAGVKTMSAELGLSGRAGGQRLRGRVLAGFVRPSAMRLEGVVAGQVIFILAAPNERATLYLPREGRVVRDERPDAMLDALTGVDLGPADLQAVLTGCVVPDGTPRGGQLFPNGWASIEMDGGATLYLQRAGAGWRLRAARRSGWRIDYEMTTGTFPASVGLRSDTGEVDLTAAIGALETNIELEAAALGRINVPPGVEAITLEELRKNGPLQGP